MNLVIHSMCVLILFKIIPSAVELALLFVSPLLFIAHFKYNRSQAGFYGPHDLFVITPYRCRCIASLMEIEWIMISYDKQCMSSVSASLII